MFCHEPQRKENEEVAGTSRTYEQDLSRCRTGPRDVGSYTEAPAAVRQLENRNI